MNPIRRQARAHMREASATIDRINRPSMFRDVPIGEGLPPSMHALGDLVSGIVDRVDRERQDLEKQTDKNRKASAAYGETIERLGGKR